MSAQGGTPRTDAAEADAEDATTYCLQGWQLSRTLEREAAALRADRDALAAALLRLRYVASTFWNDDAHNISDLDAALNRADKALAAHGGKK